MSKRIGIFFFTIIISLSVLSMISSHVVLFDTPTKAEYRMEVEGPTPINKIKKIPDNPINLSIPIINLEAQIYPVQLTKDKIVDVPKDDVGWYLGGVRPGEKGNAVLDGHYTNSQFGPGIFYNLDKLRTGQDMYVTDIKNQQFHFRIREIELVDAVNFPVEKVYGKSDTSSLNLVTCAGSYDWQKKDYTQRTIIYSELVAS